MHKTLIFLIFLSILSCHNSKQQKENTQNYNQQQQDKHIKVKIDIAKKSKFNKQILTNGIIKANQKTNLHFKNSGYLQNIFIKNGQWISKNKLVAKQENQLLQNALTKAEITVKKAQQKYQELLLSYNLNDSIIKPDEKIKLSIKSGLSEAINNLKEAKIRYNNTLLYSPFSGIVANAQNTTGKLVSPSDTIATVINPHTYHVVFKLMENEIGLIRKGLKVSIKNLSNNSSIEAIIDDINPMVAPDGTVQVKAKLTSTKHNFVEGMHVSVTINIPVSDMILIPKNALVVRNDKDVVFSLHNKNTAIWHYVDIFGENTTHYAISKGLKEGDTIIVSNNLNLAHNSIVEIEPEKQSK